MLPLYTDADRKNKTGDTAFPCVIEFACLHSSIQDATWVCFTMAALSHRCRFCTVISSAAEVEGEQSCVPAPSPLPSVFVPIVHNGEAGSSSSYPALGIFFNIPVLPAINIL